MNSKIQMPGELDWTQCYAHLKSIEVKVRQEVFATIFEKFFPKNAKLINIEDCLLYQNNDSNHQIGFYYFDKNGDVYYIDDFITEKNSYILFNWDNLRKKDLEKLMYSKANTRKLKKQDKENSKEQIIQLTKQQKMNIFSQEIKPKIFSFNEEDISEYDVLEQHTEDPFGCEVERNTKTNKETHNKTQEHYLEPLKDIFHKTQLFLGLENYPPRFKFSIQTNYAIDADAKKEFNQTLDDIANAHNLKHYCGKYVYEKHFTKSKKDNSQVIIKQRAHFVKTPFMHMFKPRYDKFII